MQRRFSSLWTQLGLGLSLWALLGLCTTGHAVSRVWIRDLEVRPGTLVSVPISLETSDPVYGLEVDIRYDAEQLIGSLAVGHGTVPEEVVVKSSLIDGGHQRLVVFSVGTDPLPSQPLAELALVVPSDIAEEPLAIQLEGLSLAGARDEALVGDVNGGVLTVVIIPEEIELAGGVTYIGSDQAMSGVLIRVEGEEIIEGPTDDSGSFKLSVPTEVPLSLSASLTIDNPPNRGVTSLDLLLLRRHILGLGPFEFPWMRLAGDVDRDGEIGAIDLLLMRSFILGISDVYQADQALFRIYPTKRSFSDPENPWDGPHEYRYTSLSADQPGQDFLGVKLGDVDGDWVPESASIGPALQKASVPSRPSFRGRRGVALELKEMPEEPGFRLFAIRCVDCIELTSLQFSLDWDPHELAFDSVRSGALLGLDAENFGTGPVHIDQGNLSFMWHSEGIDESDVRREGSLFSVRFRRFADERSRPFISEYPTPVFASRALEAVGVVLDSPVWLPMPRAVMSIKSFDDQGKGEMVVLEVMSERGRDYVFESTDSLPFGHWERLSVMGGTGDRLQFREPFGRESTRFYRVRVTRPGIPWPTEEGR